VVKGANRRIEVREPGLSEKRDMIELLLEESFAQRYRDPNRMVELADLARQAAEGLEDALLGPAATADLRARTWAELGNAYRVADNMAAAEDSLENAMLWARRGTGDIRLAAHLSDLTASLFGDQGRFAEACEVMQALFEVYEGLEEKHLAGRALISEAIFTGHAGRPQEGVVLICTALDHLDLAGDVKLKAMTLHALVFNLIESGRCRIARPLLWHIRPLYEQYDDQLNLLRLRWLEAKICDGLEDPYRAEGHFQAVRSGFKDVHQHYDSALASLDLAMLWVRQGRRAETRKLARELVSYFRALRIARETMASLIIFLSLSRSPFVSDALLLDQLRTAKTLLSELERQKPTAPQSPS
jgi:tetratricopeptide (TPR) repeat protein